MTASRDIFTLNLEVTMETVLPRTRTAFILLTN